ncbi:MAG TPA: hypothetical protein VGZ27_12555 [Vicinamibacterales bacterium]|jgi:hypothetical protein|nr:hypothetical protein [Vicinamibacterales bacterium]
MKLLAFALIIVGVLGLAYGGISYSHQKKDIDLGPLQVSHTEHDTLPIPPIAGGLCLAAGIAVLVLGGGKSG